jgi:ATP-dependent RNA/DNA helicase IGHMBP2
MQAYFQQLKELLTLEQQTDREQYKQILEQKSVHARREAGVSWYPIIIKGTEVTYGDYINIEIERPSDYVDAHQLRTGMPAVLFSQHNPKEDRAEGVIAFLRGNKMKLSTKLDELPNWVKNGKLGVDMLFDENSYTEMFNALKLADDVAEKGKSELHNVLAQKKQADFNEHLNAVLPHQHLNVFQKSAVQKIVQATQLAIVHGPPGTGKTTTLVASIIELLKHNNPKILVCAPSNVAVDLLTEKLAEQKVNVVRIGNPVRVSEAVLQHALDHKISQHASVKQIKQLRKQSADYIDMAHKYKRNFGKAEREQRKALFDEAHKIVKEIQALEDYITQDVFNKAQVITATLVGSNHYTLKNTEFDIAIIDEAAQALEPSCWIAINKSKKLILAGDHCQLPPTIKSDEAMRKGLGNTLMERLITAQPNCVVLLQEQYRMHEAIMTFPSQQLYDGKLLAHASNQFHTVFSNDAPLQFIDTAGCGFEELVEDTAISNEEEAALLLKHLVHYCTQLREQNITASIGIVSPYKRQVLALQTLIAQHTELQALAPNIAVNTIDSFQGQEKDIIYISLVRSNDSCTIGFLSDTRRMNVAITRARKKLVIVGDSATIGNNSFYQAFIDYAQSIDGYASAWEWV